MTPAEIAQAKGGEVFEFIYDRADVAQTFTFDSNDWGLYLGDGVDVAKTIRPSSESGGTWRASVTLIHLPSFTSAHVAWEGSGFTVEYTLDGTVWRTLPQHGVVSLSRNPDFDIRVTFTGGTGELISLTVYVLKTETISSIGGSRKMLVSADPMLDGSITIDNTVTVTPAIEKAGAPVSNIGTIELWVTPTTTTALTTTAGVQYKNGVPGTVTPGVKQHIVVVANTAGNFSFTIGPDLVLSHLAIYPQRMTASEVKALYDANVGVSIRIDDSATITVTEPSTAVEMYAYAWSVISG